MFDHIDVYDQAMERLNDYRNEFIHFFPKETPVWTAHLPEDFLRICVLMKKRLLIMTWFSQTLGSKEKQQIYDYISFIELNLKELADE